LARGVWRRAGSALDLNSSLRASNPPGIQAN
jgi:hypothetical protein